MRPIQPRDRRSLWLAMAMGVPGLLYANPSLSDTQQMLSAQTQVHVRHIILDGIDPDRFQYLPPSFSYGHCFLKKDKINSENRTGIFVANCILTFDELQAFKNDLTRYYIDNSHEEISNCDTAKTKEEGKTCDTVQHQFLNSGALLPDQPVKETNNDITIRIIEGRLTDIQFDKLILFPHAYHPLGNTVADWFLSRYIKRRLLYPNDDLQILDMVELRRRLELLQQDPDPQRPLLQGLQGRVAPDPNNELGQGLLKLDAYEANPFEVNVTVSNHRPPNIGAYLGQLELSHHNLIGGGDVLSLSTGISTGTRDNRGNYTIGYSFPFRLPLNPLGYDTTFAVAFDRSDSEVVTEPFEHLDVKIASDSKTTTYSLRQLLWQSYPPPPPTTDSQKRRAYQEVAVDLRIEQRHNVTFLDDLPFSFSAGATQGETEYDVLRFSPQYLSRDTQNVFYARGTFSFGLDDFLDSPTLDGWKNGCSMADSKFVTGIFQLQWFGYLNQWQPAKSTTADSSTEVSWLTNQLSNRFWASNLLMRTNAQFSSTGDVPTDPDCYKGYPDGQKPENLNKLKLLALEKFSLGGASSVRGYRENLLLRDQAIFASIEWRLPLFYLPFPGLSQRGDGLLWVVPFVDYGRGRDGDPGGDKEDVAYNDSKVPKDISSVGLGLLWSPHKMIDTQLYWGKPLRNVKAPEGEEHDLQDEGIHFQVQMKWPF